MYIAAIHTHDIGFGVLVQEVNQVIFKVFIGVFHFRQHVVDRNIEAVGVLWRHFRDVLIYFGMQNRTVQHTWIGNVDVIEKMRLVPVIPLDPHFFFVAGKLRRLRFNRGFYHFGGHAAGVFANNFRL